MYGFKTSNACNRCGGMRLPFKSMCRRCWRKRRRLTSERREERLLAENLWTPPAEPTTDALPLYWVSTEEEQRQVDEAQKRRDEIEAGWKENLERRVRWGACHAQAPDTPRYLPTPSRPPVEFPTDRPTRMRLQPDGTWVPVGQP